MDGVRLNELRVRTGAALAEAPDAPEERRLELRIGREVMCGHDLVGRLERLVVDPISGRVHQLVVRHAQRPLLIGLDLVEREDDGVIYLDPHACDVERLPSYDPTRFVLRGDVAYALGGSLEELQALRRARQGTTGGPAGVEVTRGTEVVATDGRIGRVRHVLLDRTSGAVTHVVVRREPVPLITLGDVVVPLSWARSIRPERIELAVSRAELAELPEFRTDEEIEAEVLRRFAADARFAGIDRYTLNVSVDGGVVRLKGRARSVELKRAAEELARTTPGVLAVDNEVIADDELAAEVERALRADPRLHFEELEVLVLLGQVKLRGRVPTPDERRHAGELARHVAGVESVVNQLGVAPA
jgi:osmotically-inducible protein OsmY/sporulation protein YlmC with PRC-barrel domain